jgi:hypothetical protein
MGEKVQTFHERNVQTFRWFRVVAIGDVAAGVERGMAAKPEPKAGDSHGQDGGKWCS